MIAAVMAPVGLQAALLPRSFFDDFPIGRSWIAATGGGYNEHLARDVGVLFLSLVLATAWTAITRAGDHAIAVAWILQGVTHLAFHTAHLHGLGWPDATSLLVSLIAVPVLAIVALRHPTDRRADRATS